MFKICKDHILFELCLWKKKEERIKERRKKKKELKKEERRRKKRNKIESFKFVFFKLVKG